MFEKSTIGVFIVESPVHCGVGQDVGVVDQPIQRERHTGYPMIQGSEIKGCFRQYYKKGNRNEIFGPEDADKEENSYASAVSFGDARVLFFPVKSLKGTYVWITSRDVMGKFKRSLTMAGIDNITLPDIQQNLTDEHILHYDDSIVVNGKIVLEEYMFIATKGNNKFDIIDSIIPKDANEYSYLKESLKKKICVVSDDIFREFTTMSTEVITRIRINDETGVVDAGALWTEEYLPADSILYFPVFAVGTRNTGDKLTADKVIANIKSLNSYIQIGGNETIGKGFVKINWIDEGGN